jgi:peptidoglycan/LPS O-acetylase OafA/YrhL
MRLRAARRDALQVTPPVERTAGTRSTRRGPLASGPGRRHPLKRRGAPLTSVASRRSRDGGSVKPTAKTAHRSDIQGLRGVAVLLVVLGHAGVGVLRGGYVGVDVFFVLSGFLITGLLLAEGRERGSISLSKFYCRRARRILPAAGVTLLATMLAATYLLNFVRARDAVWDGVAATGFTANFRFARLGTDYFAQGQPPSPVLHFWSLAVEEQFYLVWPALLSLVLLGSGLGSRRRRFHRGRLLAVVTLAGSASLAWSVWQTREFPRVAYFSPFTRAWELALGAALAIGAGASVRWHPHWRALAGWLGLAAIAVAAISYTESTPFPGTAALLPTIGTALVIWAGIGTRAARLTPARLLELQPLRYVGDCSYSLYLWHWPLLAIAPLYLGHRLSVSANLALVAVAFVLSIASYEAIENPIRRARWSRRRTALVFTASTVFVLVGAAASLAAISSEKARFETRAPAAGERGTAVSIIPSTSVTGRHATTAAALPEVVAAVQAALRDDPLPTGLTPSVEHVGAVPARYVLPRGCVPVAASNDSSSLLCPIGRTTSRRTIVLIGDSHAQMWLPAVLQLAERDGWRVIPLLRPGCTPDTWVDEHGLAACRPWFRWATRQVLVLRPEVTLVGGAVGATTGVTARAAVHGLLTMIRQLRPASHRVVTIGDPEGLVRNPVDCLLAPHASMGTCTTTWPAWRLEPYDRVAAGAKKLGGGFIDNRGWFCFERRCPTVIGHTIAYRDWHHITVTYALHLAPVFRSTFRQLRVG